MAGPFTAGQRITAAALDSFCAPVAAIKGANQSVTSSTTLVNDSALFLPVVANASYIMFTAVHFEAASGGDMKFQWTVPASATLVGQISYRNLTPADVVHGVIAAATVLSTAGSGAGVALALSATGTLITAGTAGNLQFQWAENTSNATPTIVHAQSYICAWRIT